MEKKKLGFAKSFEELHVFQRAYKISLSIHRTSLRFPPIEQGNSAMGGQMRRASKSICANLAEGFGKNASSADVRRFILMALGSCEEMRVWLRYCLDLELIDEATWVEWRDEYAEIARMLQGFANPTKKNAAA